VTQPLILINEDEAIIAAKTTEPPRAVKECRPLEKALSCSRPLSNLN
jgi:hypothetical protein